MRGLGAFRTLETVAVEGRHHDAASLRRSLARPSLHRTGCGKERSGKAERKIKRGFQVPTTDVPLNWGFGCPSEAHEARLTGPARIQINHSNSKRVSRCSPCAC
jgi:hypothetical protein